MGSYTDLLLPTCYLGAWPNGPLGWWFPSRLLLATKVSSHHRTSHFTVRTVSLPHSEISKLNSYIVSGKPILLEAKQRPIATQSVCAGVLDFTAPDGWYCTDRVLDLRVLIDCAASRRPNGCVSTLV